MTAKYHGYNGYGVFVTMAHEGRELLGELVSVAEDGTCHVRFMNREPWPITPKEDQLTELERETPAQRAARQLAWLMARHGIAHGAAFETLQRAAGVSHVVSQVTIRRILKAEAATEPEKTTLRRLAAAVGESYEAAFPEPGFERAPVIVVDGQHFTLTSADNRAVDPAMVRRIQDLVDRASKEK